MQKRQMVVWEEGKGRLVASRDCHHVLRTHGRRSHHPILSANERSGLRILHGLCSNKSTHMGALLDGQVTMPTCPPAPIKTLP